MRRRYGLKGHMMEKLTKKIEFVGDKLNASNFTTEFRIASYKTKDRSKFDLSDAATIAYGNYRLEQAPTPDIYGDTMDVYYHNTLV